MGQLHLVGHGDILTLSQDWEITVHPGYKGAVKLAKAFGASVQRPDWFEDPVTKQWKQKEAISTQVTIPAGTRLEVNKYYSDCHRKWRWLRLSIKDSPMAKLNGYTFYVEMDDAERMELLDAGTPQPAVPALTGYDPHEDE